VRVRVAISWWANADCPDENNCNYDRLDTDLHLGVKDPDNQWVGDAWSASWDNNYELVEFIAPKTGQYKIAVYKKRADEDSNSLGIAWVRDATYLPDLRNNSSGVSEIRLLNIGTASRDVAVHYFNAEGKESDVCSLNPNQSCWIPLNEHNRIPAGTTGSAIVGGGEDVSVLVRNKRYSELTLYNGIRASGGSPGWEQVGTTLYVPVVKNNWYGRYSKIRVLNTGSTDTTVTVAYYLHDSGEYQGSSTQTLAPNARGTFYASSECGPGQYCTAAITSNNGQPLAAVVCEYESGGGAPATYNASSAGSTSGYVPVVKKNWPDPNGQSTGISVMNASTDSADVWVTYYNARSDNTETEFIDDLPGRAVAVLYNPSSLPDTFLGSAVIEATEPVVALVHEGGGGLYKASNAFLGGTGEAYVPEVFNTSIRGGITIQNLHGGQTARVWARYYDTGGAWVEDTAWRYISPGEAYSFHSWNGGLPDDFHGSARVESQGGQPVGVIVNEVRSGSGDTHATYNGSQP
jgi:hypothetical protein